MSKTIIVIRHGESEWNATPRPDREQWYFKQLEAAEQEAHNNKLLGMFIISLSISLSTLLLSYFSPTLLILNFNLININFSNVHP